MKLLIRLTRGSSFDSIGGHPYTAESVADAAVLWRINESNQRQSEIIGLPFQVMIPMIWLLHDINHHGSSFYLLQRLVILSSSHIQAFACCFAKFSPAWRCKIHLQSQEIGWWRTVHHKHRSRWLHLPWESHQPWWVADESCRCWSADLYI